MKYVTGIIILLLIASCATSKRTIRNNALEHAHTANYLLGFKIYDPEKDKSILEYNANRYFNPASTTKIFTLYTSLRLLGDSVPSFRYMEQKDTLFIYPTGDPTLLHPYFKQEKAIQLIKSTEASTVFINTSAYKDELYGPGWSWEDYMFYFMPERNAFPLYGNVVETFTREDSLMVQPSLFRDYATISEAPYTRPYRENLFYHVPLNGDTLHIPYITGDSLTKKIVAQLTGKNVATGSHSPYPVSGNLVRSIPSDSLYKRMMEKSDNFLAEQMMVLGSSQLFSDTLSVKKTIAYSLDSLLNDIPQKPRWVDGSGLSRYNLFTPESFIYILGKLYHLINRERLYQFFPIGNNTDGTFGSQPRSIYAKSGYFSNNYCLSGYLVTKSGKTLFFSFMANHYKIPTNEIKDQAVQLLTYVRERY
ncbi:D-alanyl-D-alanine carboxypeptidase [Ascidiimonas aurantiaca]|uniref:D-alanyl-D-alanine carboxypeptidase n=1 Tax=Ascidiimonas aurantiaca TaxID=1685432 RepID=UPI0030EE2E65